MDYSLFNWYNEQNLANSPTEVKALFLHKSDLIPFIVELSPYISGTAAVSLLLKPVKKRDMFSRCFKTYKPGVILFLLGEVHHLQGACMYCASKQPLYNSLRT